MLRFALIMMLALVVQGCGTDEPSEADAGGPTPEAGPPDADAGPTPPTAMTAHGPVVGAREDGAQAFLGIPFAAPPVGERRWQPPSAPDAWVEPRDATMAPPKCSQRALGIRLASQEDCLYLNVHTPDPMPESAPVMVWIHGGGFVFGEGLQADQGTAGTNLAREHGVVVVSMNYRLGPFGFLAHSELSGAQGGTSGNYGFMDQQMALEWVRDNIANFGGDPSQVTLFGESAGGISVCAHMVAPQSQNLFQRVINQSGLCDTEWATLAQSEMTGAEFIRGLGCADAPDVLACAREKSADEISESDSMSASAFTSLGGGRGWSPNVDGTLLPTGFRAAVMADAVPNIPSVFGWTRDEGTLFVMLAEQAGTTVDEAVYREVATRLAEASGVSAEAVLAQYPLSDYDDPGAAAAAIIGHSNLACPSRRAARLLAGAGREVYSYRFDYPDAGFQLPSMRALGAFHSGEIQFIFGYPSPIGQTEFMGDEAALHQAMAAYWARFAWGDTEPEGYPAWPSYSEPSYAGVVFDRMISVADDLNMSDCELWDSGS